VTEGCKDGCIGDSWGDIDSAFWEGVRAVSTPQAPNLASVRERTSKASEGKSTFHLLDKTLRIASVRRAQSQPSAISSRCLTPWVMSRLAFLSGRLSR
jgi:hypothetical protein